MVLRPWIKAYRPLFALHRPIAAGRGGVRLAALAALALGLSAAMAVHPQAAQSETYKISAGEMPATPIFVEILKTIEAADPGLKFEVTVAPFPRSIKAAVEDRTADAQSPVIRPADEPRVPFDVSAATAFQTPFMLYENKSKPLDMGDLQQYKIETNPTHVTIFPFPTIGSADIRGSLRKVDAGRIDGFIFGAYSADQELIAGGFKNIHRRLYARMDVAFVLPKGGKGGPVDQALTRAVAAARNTQLYKDAVAKYQAMCKGEDWQQ